MARSNQPLITPIVYPRGGDYRDAKEIAEINEVPQQDEDLLNPPPEV